MHQGNRDFLDSLRVRFPEAFALGARVLELGSLDINGSARTWWPHAEYVGLDRVAGPGVDLLVDANDPCWIVDFTVVDVLVSMSMLEHNEAWWLALEHGLRVCRRGGLIILSWGAEGNQHHAPEPWRPVTVFEFFKWLSTRDDVEWLDGYFERDRHTPDATGCYNFIGRRS